MKTNSGMLVITRGALLGILVAYLLLIFGGIYIVHLNRQLQRERSGRIAANHALIVATCQSTNNVVEAVRTVLADGIKAAERGEKALPQFKAQYQEQILQSREYLANLFVVQKC